jgi:hypothetical protein
VREERFHVCLNHEEDTKHSKDLFCLKSGFRALLALRAFVVHLLFSRLSD